MAEMPFLMPMLACVSTYTRGARNLFHATASGDRRSDEVLSFKGRGQRRSPHKDARTDRNIFPPTSLMALERLIKASARSNRSLKCCMLLSPPDGRTCSTSPGDFLYIAYNF